MQPKIIKIIAIVLGVILAWALAFVIFGKKSDSSKATIEFWNVFDTTDTMEPFLKEFTKKTGIKVNYRSFTDLDDYRETLLFEFAGGEGPDVLAVNAKWIPKYRSLLFPLPEEIGYSAKDVSKDFLDAVDSAVVSDDGVIGLPMYLDTLALYYNKTYFRNILSKPYPAPESTWEGVRDDVIQLTTKDNTDPEGFKLAGIALGRADNIMRGVDIFYTLYHQFGGEDLTNAAKETARDDSNYYSYNPLLAALDFMTSFSRDDHSQEYSWNAAISKDAPEKEIDAFARGKVAMIAGYSYYLDAIKDLAGKGKELSDNPIKISEIGIAPIPQMYDPKQGNPKTALADFFALAVAKSSEHPYESWRLILELTSRDVQEQYHEATKKPTSRRDLIEDQKEDPQLGVFAEQAVYADVLPVADDELFGESIADALNTISDGEIDPNKAAKTLEKVFIPMAN